MYEAVQDSISNRRVADLFMPMFHGQLTGNNSRSVAVPFFDNLQQVASFREYSRDIIPIIHIACAIETVCDCFLTTDDQIIKIMEDFKPMMVMNPITFVTSVEH